MEQCHRPPAQVGLYIYLGMAPPVQVGLYTYMGMDPPVQNGLVCFHANGSTSAEWACILKLNVNSATSAGELEYLHWNAWLHGVGVLEFSHGNGYTSEGGLVILHGRRATGTVRLV